MLLLLLWTASGVSAEGGVDITYEGQLDVSSEEPAPLLLGAASAEEKKTRIEISNGAVYDTLLKKYCYTIENAEVMMSLPDGIVTTSGVTLEIPTGIAAKFYRGGKEIAAPESTTITEPGSYVVLFGATGIDRLSFRIIPALTGEISEYTIPVGFSVASAKLNGETLPHSSGFLDMSADGVYDIGITCRKTGVSHSLNVTLDHSFPTLRVPEQINNGSIAGPVDLSDREKNSTIRIIHNGKQIPYAQLLTSSGQYQIDLTDAAGNTTTYHFMIRVYFNTSGVMFVILLVLVLAAVAAYIVYSRRKFRIR